MLFGENRGVKLSVVDKIVRAKVVQFGKQGQFHHPKIARLTNLSHANSIPSVTHSTAASETSSKSGKSESKSSMASVEFSSLKKDSTS